MERRHQDLLKLHPPRTARTNQDQNHVHFDSETQDSSRQQEHLDREGRRPSVELVTMSTQTQAASDDEENRIQIQEIQKHKRSTATDDAEELMARMKRDLDAQWVQLASRMQE